MSDNKASKPVMYNKDKWDVATGLDYSGSPPEVFKSKYIHHDFPPLIKNIKIVSQSDLEGRGDAAQVVKHGHYLYICHSFTGGCSVVDVKDPASPQVVNFIPTDSPHLWSVKCRVSGNILIIANEWKFFEPEIYHTNTQYRNFHQRGPKEPIQSGIKIFDISKPAEPKFLSFFKTGQWSRDGGGNYCHRFWFDGHYAYISADMPGYTGGIMLIVDVSDPKDPVEVSRYWLKGQWIAGGERPWWGNTFPGCQCHHPIVQGDRAYVTWFGLGGTILDISNIKMPTLVSEFNYDMGGQNHTFLPIQNQQFAVFVSEYRHAYMLDIHEEKYPRVVGMFPKPPRELLKRGVGYPYGPSIHNIHENTAGPDSLRSDDRIYATLGPGGFRIYDVADPYRIEELAHYVPGTPKVYYSPYGVENTLVGAGVDVMDVFVDNKGLIYTTSYNAGLEILEYTG